MQQTTHVHTISKEEIARKLNTQSSVQIVNVLAPQYYSLGFIANSKRIPLDQLDKRWGELDKDKEVITYCAGGGCTASLEAAEKLASKGFKVSVYEGGIKDWKENGLPTEY